MRRVHIEKPAKRVPKPEPKSLVNWGVQNYQPHTCVLDPYKRLHQIGLVGLASSPKHVLQFTLATVERLMKNGTRTMRVFVVAMGGWTHEEDMTADRALALARRLVKKG